METTKTPLYANNARVHVLGYGMGTVIGRVDTSTRYAIRIQFDSKNVHDFAPSKLVKLLIPVNETESTGVSKSYTLASPLTITETKTCVRFTRAPLHEPVKDNVSGDYVDKATANELLQALENLVSKGASATAHDYEIGIQAIKKATE